jgi:hypothetical protein
LTKAGGRDQEPDLRKMMMGQDRRILDQNWIPSVQLELTGELKAPRESSGMKRTIFDFWLPLTLEPH